MIGTDYDDADEYDGTVTTDRDATADRDTTVAAHGTTAVDPAAPSVGRAGVSNRATPSVVLGGRLDHERPLAFDYPTLVGLPWRERACTLQCTSGRRFDGPWQGVALASLIEATAATDVTHLVVADRSGYVACVPIATALDGVLAFERDGDSLLAEHRAPRFVAPGIGGPRAVTSVRRLEFRRLAPDEDRADYEHLVRSAP